MRALALLLLSPTLAQAGPWTRDAGSAYIKLSSGLYLADEFFGSDGTVRGGVSYLGMTQAIYAEVGVTDGLQLVAYLPHQTATNTFDGVGQFRSARLGDARLGVQYGLPGLPLPVAVRAEVKVPLYDAGEPKGPNRAQFPLIGDGQIDTNIWLSAGGSIPGLPVYGFVEVGHQFRSETYIGDGLGWSFADGFLGAGQLGLSVTDGLIAAVNVNAVLPYVDQASTKAYLTVGPSLFWRLWSGLALEGSADFTPWARHSAKGTALTFGLSWSQSS